MSGLFVTGTDTNVGKTVVSAALLHRYRSLRARYWKPVQTGIEIDDDTGTVQRLTGVESQALIEAGVRLTLPLSPHLAAALSGGTIALDELTAMYEENRGWPLIVEGAGGVLVPLNAQDLVIDLMAALGLPVLVAARTTLGTINHTLLTLEALRRRDLVVAGVVMSGEPNEDNRRAIERYGDIAVISTIPLMTPLNRDTFRAWVDANFDPSSLLEEYFR
ncbi:MAG TPA: dethiobiotin synthase [Thermoanaerobaculia bacterium]|nr:dethiobiotin synthase [Thermoanaerobaculia bacterium]